MRSIFFLTICFYALIIFSCDENVPYTKQQYVIKAYFDNDTNDPDWFVVINISTKKAQPVPAVKELNGNYYLPIMSRYPTFLNKVVEGEFYFDKPFGFQKQDTVFRVTKHLRDTTRMLYGN